MGRLIPFQRDGLHSGSTHTLHFGHFGFESLLAGVFKESEYAVALDEFIGQQLGGDVYHLIMLQRAADGIIGVGS